MQVIADKLLKTAAREKAAYTSSYDGPIYAVHLAKALCYLLRDSLCAVHQIGMVLLLPHCMCR